MALAGRVVAYFSMEIALHEAVPTYSGGLGVLAGDHLRAAADAGLPMVGVTLLYRQGYFGQQLDPDGTQHELPETWDPSERLELLPVQARVQIGDEAALVGIWRYVVTGVHGHQVPVYLLDTAQPGNSEETGALTDRLYAGDGAHRLAQEIVLGMGGVAALEATGQREVGTFHMNEGHSALLALSLWRAAEGSAEQRRRAVRRRCVFTTHTPVPAGHDRFPRALVERLLGSEAAGELDALGGMHRDELDMTRLGIGSSRVVNAVSQRHGEVTRAMFTGAHIDSVTNGVHAAFWAAPATARLFDHHLPGWREDNTRLRQVTAVALEEVAAAHDESKQVLLDRLAALSGRRLDPKALTVGFARRATAYKRMGLLLSDPDRLLAMTREVGPLQVVMAGKAHPRDEGGKAGIRAVVDVAGRLAPALQVVFVPGYDMALARMLCAGADVWLNTPRRPHEASGTSGMKAAVNGVPSVSILDGWWLEGHVEGVTGWAVGPAWTGDDRHGALPADADDDRLDDEADADDLYRTLAEAVLPLYYGDPEAFTAVRRFAMALNGSYFTTQRMLADYCRVAYDVVG